MIENFGRLPDGRDVHRVTLKSGDAIARVLTFGTILQDLRLKAGGASLVLGLATLDEYLEHSRSFGITAGRCANRIGNAQFDLDGKTYNVDANFLGKHLLHGGSDGTGKRLWEIVDHGSDFVTMAHRLPDGHMGFPGALDMRVSFRLESGALDIVMSATTDAATLCNLAHHSYWVLDDSGSILDHLFQVSADTFTPVDEDLIPTGETPSVEGTHLDFRTARRLREGSLKDLIDHNYCLSSEKVDPRPVAVLESQKSNLKMTIVTDQPGLQVYDAGVMDVPINDVDGRALTAHSGIALEPQIWPDAINNSHFPSAVLRPGETYNQHTRFEFERVT